MSLHDTEPFPGSYPDKGARAKQGTCAYGDCPEKGEYRAPKSRNSDEGHYWFCLEHIREYNAAWNYYEGMNEAQIEAHRREDATWQRPTWKLGARAPFTDFRDDLGVFGDHGNPFTSQENREPPRPTSPEERQALSTLGLQAGVTWREVRARYKELVKRYHPDANGGDAKAEDRLKRVTAAYAHLATLGYA